MTRKAASANRRCGRALLAGPVLLCGWLALPGCAPLNIHAPADAREALDNINANLAGMERALNAKPAIVSFRFRDADGKDRRFLFHPATVLFGGPRCLYFDIKDTLSEASVARIGSNDERYWLWVDAPDLRKLWWGTWEALEAGRAQPLLVPPDQLLDVLLLRPLPVELSGGLPPLLIDADGVQRLLFQQRDEQGWPYVAREMHLSRRAPFLPVKVIDRSADGRVVMDANVGRYARVRESGTDGPYTPRKYVVKWPEGEAEMALDLLGVRYRESELPFCDFPHGWRGEVERLDAPPVPELSRAEGTEARRHEGKERSPTRKRSRERERAGSESASRFTGSAP